MKKKLMILFTLLLTGCTSIDDIKIKNNSINVYDEFYASDFSFTKDIEVLGNIKVNTSFVGKHELVLPIKYNNAFAYYTFEYNVVDGEAPIFVNAPSSKTIKLNDSYDPCNDAVLADNYDKKPKCKVEGSFDTSVEGSYKVEYVISDSSKNERTKSLTINVVPEIVSNPNKNPVNYIAFEDVIANYKTDNTMIGIDVSRWQGDIDYTKVKEAGCEFVMMRMGVAMNPKEDLAMDSFFLKNIENAKKAGLKVGVYVYSSATDEMTALKHAKWVHKNLKNYEIDLGVSYDWENWSKFQKYNISIKDLNDTYKVFARYMKNKGYNPILYGSKSYLERMWDETKDDVWLAHYTSHTSYDKPYLLWQMTDKGKIDGIKDPVDIDILNIKKALR